MARQSSHETFKRRSGFSACAVILVLALLFVSILRIQMVHGKEYDMAIQDQLGSAYNQELPALRGTIVDRSGNVLAESRRVYNVIVDPLALQKADEAVQQSTVRLVARILDVKDLSLLEKYLSKEYSDSQYERFSAGYGISESLKTQLQEYIRTGDIAGIWFEEVQNRLYPSGELAAHVIGFNSAYGVEASYDRELSGTPGRVVASVGLDGETSEERIEAVDGNTLVLCLDQSLQFYVEEALASAMEREKCLRVTAIMMNPKNGEIYAMASYPTFDLNRVERVIGLTDKYTDEMISNELFLPSIWTNWAITGSYQPGSTFKTVFAASALDSASINDTETFECESQIYYAGNYFKCAFYKAHGVETVRDVIMNSCNVGMIQISSRISTAEYMKYQNAFGIGKLTGIDLPYEISAENLVYNEEIMGNVERATTAFGQGFNVTPIQLITAVSACVNDGKMVWPHVVKEIRSASGELVSETDARVVRQIISSETSQVIREAMAAVVKNEWGDGSSMGLAGYHIGGKTGTAEKDDYSEGKYIVSFISFAPIEDPEVGLLVILDEADMGTSYAAQEVAAEILVRALPYLNIYPAEE